MEEIHRRETDDRKQLYGKRNVVTVFSVDRRRTHEPFQSSPGLHN